MCDNEASVLDMFSSYKQNVDLLMLHKEFSFAMEYKSQQAKVVILASASYFESRLVSIVLKSLNSNNCQLTDNFIAKKALARQYHALFSWESKNANHFFSLFGDKFKSFMLNKTTDNILRSEIESFLEIGNLRNKLAHNNYAVFTLDLTVEEIENKHLSAARFVEKIPDFFNEFRRSLITN